MFNYKADTEELYSILVFVTVFLISNLELPPFIAPYEKIKI